jgi:hypothetical protein
MNNNNTDPLSISLPYIDAYINDQETQKEIVLLIENEMKNMEQKDYLKDLKSNNKRGLFDYNPIVQREYERLVQNIPTDTLCEKAIRITRVNNSNSNSKDDRKEFLKKQIKIAKAIAEEQSVQISNLELLQHHGGSAWKLHCADVESITNLNSKYTQSLSEELNDAQLQRHDIQERSRKTIHALENEFLMLAERNKKMRQLI